MALDENDRRRRAELALELGFHPATLRAEDIDVHRRLNAARSLTWRQVMDKYAHLREGKRREEAVSAGREAVADLYE
jgi:hypothetical protein